MKPRNKALVPAIVAAPFACWVAGCTTGADGKRHLDGKTIRALERTALRVGESMQGK